MKAGKAACVLFCAAALPSHALARPGFEAAVPSTFLAPNNCRNCHQSSTGGSNWNAYGDDLRATLVNNLPDWSAVCALDSDEDTFTNGEELGDEDCTWTIGSPATVALSDPAELASVPGLTSTTAIRPGFSTGGVGGGGCRAQGEVRWAWIVLLGLLLQGTRRRNPGSL